MVEAGLLGAATILGAPITRHRDETRRTAGRLLLQPGRNLVAIQPGEADVAQDHVWAELKRCLQPFWPGTRYGYLVADRLEKFLERLGGIQAVLDNENAQRFYSLSRLDTAAAASGSRTVN
jgi:hypothetical protein